jgi:hypothetical protein
MAFGISSAVVTTASVKGPPGFLGLHSQAPQIGVVESLTPGAPPTAVIVDWRDGTRRTYTAVNSGAASVLAQIVNITQPYIVGFTVQPTAASGIPNPGGRLRGVVVDQLNLADPVDAALDEVLVVQTPNGYLVARYTDMEIVPSA